MGLAVLGNKAPNGPRKPNQTKTDAFSKLVKLVPIRNKEVKTVAAAIVDTWICQYACPKQIVTHRGRDFCNKLADELYKNIGVQHLCMSTYHPHRKL